MDEVKRSYDEVAQVLHWTWAPEEGRSSGSAFPGMSFEEGVRAGIEWLLGQTDVSPMDE